MALQSQRDVPGTKREYETIYILRPDANTEQIHDVNTRVRKLIEDREGQLIRVDNWGKRKLAYEINKELKGIYLYWMYLGGSDLVAEIERNLRMLDMVIRYYTVKVDEGVDPSARPSQMDEESFAATATTVPDEEDAYLGRGQSDEESGQEAKTEAKTEAKPEEAKTEAKPEEAKTEAKPEEAKTEEAKAETKAEEPKAEEPKAEAATTEEPKADTTEKKED